MNGNSIERMLEINNKIEKGNVDRTPKSNPKVARTQQELDRLIESYDNMAYGPSQDLNNDTEKYDPQKEMEYLKEVSERGGRGSVNLEGRNIPKGIVESILNNPLDLKPIDPKMDAFEERLKNKMSGIKAAANIFERVQKKDEEAKAKLIEQVAPMHNNNASIDYELIKTIVESAIDKRLSEIKTTLNESSVRQQTYVPSMKMMNFKDKFYFVDNDDNVFECEMKYKGKRKKKS